MADYLAPAVIVIVGAGPRGTGLVERIGANSDLLFADRPVQLHLVDPHPAGAGRVWRHDQSPLLRMNSMAEDVTMFTDDSVTCEGPIRPGPSLAEWARLFRDRDGADPEVQAELDALAPTDFPTRRVQSAYLSWVFEHTVKLLPPNISVTVHRTVATSVTGTPSTRQRVWLADRRTPLVADVVVLALGHLDAAPSPEHELLRDFSLQHNRFYLPPAYSSDVDLSGIKAGESVIMRGFGLAFIDLMVLLTEGRGGRYRTEPDGELTYLPSGAEPVLYVGSRRGVPYHSKTGYQLRGDRPPLPRFFDATAVDGLLATHEQLEFRRDVWPLLAKEIAWGFYHELFTGHPERVALDWESFAAQYQFLPWYSAEMRALVERSVPAQEDRIDFERLDRPIEAMEFDDLEGLQHYLRDYIAADVTRRADQAHSADLGAFLALLSVFGQLPRLLASGKLSARSQVRELDGWWFGFFSFLASGPPGPRLQQLLALSRAGLVRFLGADMWVEPDPVTGTFRAGSASVREVIEATALVEARLPKPSIRRGPDALLRALREHGEGVEEVLVDAENSFSHNTGLLKVSPEDARVVDRDGFPHPRRFAIGPHTNGRSFAAFARPNTNAPVFRQNDATARAILDLLNTSYRTVMEAS